jgi:hypothetical protein
MFSTRNRFKWVIAFTLIWLILLIVTELSDRKKENEKRVHDEQSKTV